MGDPILLEQLVRNLVENAWRHNTADGWISLSTAIVDGAAELRVSNTGPAVQPHDVDGLFEPFRRNRADRTSGGRTDFGLGLAIVKAVADAHHGTLSARARPEGGLDLRVWLPQASTS